jgi:YVTN family beta-propeller protein
MATSTAFVTNTDSNDISVVSMQERREIARIPVGGSPRGSVRIAPDKKYGYVSNTAGNTISIIDLEHYKEAGRITVGLSPRGLILSEDGKFAFVSNSGSDTLSIVDLEARQTVGELKLESNPRHMARVPRAARILVSQWGSDSIAVINLSEPSRPSVERRVPVGDGARPYSVASSTTGQAYVANTQANYVSVLDTESLREVVRIEVGPGSRAIVFTPDEKYAFVSVENLNDIAVIDTATNQVIHRVEIGPSPRGLAFDPVTKVVAGGNFGRSMSAVADRNTMGLVDAANPPRARFVSAVPVGLGPCSVSMLS